METTDLHLPQEKTVYKSQTTEREKLLKRFTWAVDVLLKHSGKCITNFPGEIFDLSEQFRNSLLAGEAVYLQFTVHPPQNAPDSQ